MKLEPFEKKLIYLFNLVAKSPLGVKPIFFGDGRKVGKQHQNVLVFYKGDTKNIKGNYNKHGQIAAESVI